MLILALSLPTTIAYADQAQLLEDCGGHTNYGLARDSSETKTVSSDSASAMSMQASNTKEKTSTKKDDFARRQDKPSTKQK